jgi:PAS domain S-box-containing protein
MIHRGAFFNSEYAAAMQDYLNGHGEDALRRAYEAGRRALAEGLGILEMASAHQESVMRALRFEQDECARDRIRDRALACFAESLSPFEMVLRGVREANVRLEQSITSLQGVEEQLRQQNERLIAAHHAVEKERSRYQALFDFAPDGYLVTGLEGAIREANTAAAAILNTPKTLLPGQSLSEFVARADRELFRERLHQLHLGSLERVEDWEVSLEPRNRPPLPAALTVVSERTAPAVASLRWLIRDVTERKRLEKERARWLVGRARAQAARRFEFLAQASSLLVESLDVESSLTRLAHLAASFLPGWCFINVAEQDGALRQLEVAQADPSAADLAKELRRHCLFGANATAEQRGFADQLEIVEPLTAEWYERVSSGTEHAELLRRMNGGGAMILPLRFRHRLMGVLTLISPHGRRRFRPADRVMGDDLARRCALALENARLYREMAAERDKAERANRAKDEFVAILGHELKNPLTPVIGWTQVFKNHALISKDPVLAEGIKALEKNARTLTRLVGDCVDLTKISEGMIQIDRTPLNLNSVVAASVELVRAMAADRQLELHLDLPAQPSLALGDAMRLEQVLLNLLINAVKYTEPGGCIWVRTVCMGGEIEVQVQDTGIGIDPAFLAQIFEPFRHGSRSWLTSKSGLGLGLAIARRIVEMHGGRIWGESSGLGAGSTFRIRIPRAAAGTDVPSDLKAPAPGAARAQMGIRILLVEDSEDILFLMKTQLESIGHQVITASNGKRGIEVAKNHALDLIISDVKMPSVDGYELIRTLRKFPEFSATPAIALTGFGSKEDIERALAAGFNTCIRKPAEVDEISSVIRQLTEGRQAVRAGSPPG